MINKINNPSEEKSTGEENISEGFRPPKNAGRCIKQASKSNHNKLSKQTKKSTSVVQQTSITVQEVQLVEPQGNRGLL